MPEIRKVSVAMTSEQIATLKAAVDAGEYATTSEAVREALREWQWKRQQRTEELNRLREQWREGKASGTATPLDVADIREQARKKLRKATERIA